MADEIKTEKPEKGLWSFLKRVFQNNRDLDSTGLLAVVGGGTILNQILCYLSPSSYATTEVAMKITESYDGALLAMVLYFFSKGAAQQVQQVLDGNGNGNGEKK